MINRTAKKLFAVLIVTMMILGAIPISASAATAAQIGDQINAIGGLSANVVGNTVTVTGTATDIASRTLTLNVESGVRVVWRAEYRGTANPVIDFIGGELVIEAGAWIKNVSSVNSFTAIRATNTAVVVNNGHVQAGLGSAIEGAGTTRVTVNGGQVFNCATHNLRPVINMTNETYTGLNITINGGEVFADLTGTTATTYYGYVLQTYGNVLIDGGTVSTNGKNGRGINLTGRNSVATVLSGSVIATGENGVAISTATTPGVDVTETRVNITGGFVASYGTGASSWAIHTTGTQSTVSVSDGCVFSYGTRITGPSYSVIYTEKNSAGFLGTSGNGGVIAWDRQAWNNPAGHSRGVYFVDRDDHITTLPTGGTALWGNDPSNPDGIRFDFGGGNIGFVALPEVTVVAPTYTITVYTDSNGTINLDPPSGSGPWVVSYGATPTFTITPGSNNERIVKIVLLTGGSGENDPQLIYPNGVGPFNPGEAFSYTFDPVDRDRILRAYFAPINPPSHTIVAFAGDGGAVVDAGAEFTGTNPHYQAASVNTNGNIDVDVTFRADDGYHIEKVLLDGYRLDLPTPNPTEFRYQHLFPTVTEDHVITATFEPIPHAINATAGGGGDISPSGIVNVPYGDDAPFRISPNPGHFINFVLVDDAPEIPARRAFEFRNVTRPHTIHAAFSPVEYHYHRITATAGSNGAISPSGNVDVPDGGDRTFTITPNAGFRVRAVLVDGVSVGAVTEYSFIEVRGPHTIHAEFVPDAPPSPPTGDDRTLALSIAMLVLGLLTIVGTELCRRRFKAKR